MRKATLEQSSLDNLPSWIEKEKVKLQLLAFTLLMLVGFCVILSALLDHWTLLHRSKLNRARVETEDSSQESEETYSAAPIKLDAAVQAQIEKHRKLREELVDEMFVLDSKLRKAVF